MSDATTTPLGMDTWIPSFVKLKAADCSRSPISRLHCILYTALQRSFVEDQKLHRHIALPPNVAQQRRVNIYVLADVAQLCGLASFTFNILFWFASAWFCIRLRPCLLHVARAFQVLPLPEQPDNFAASRTKPQHQPEPIVAPYLRQGITT